MRQKRITRRKFIATTGAASLAAGCSGAASNGNGAEAESAPEAVEVVASAPSAAPRRERPSGRVVILGFDGIEPRILSDLMAAGEVPNFAKLRDEGGFERLETTAPPQSPTAWTSFATCKNPGGHGIFDFIRRDPRRMFPAVGTGRFDQAMVDTSGRLQQPASSVAYRQGDPFWVAADRQGLRTVILSVPFAFPADRLEHGRMLCGLGVPDLRGTTSVFFSFSDAHNEREDVSGGQKIPLIFDGTTAHATFQGARDVTQQGQAFVEEQLTIQADREAQRATVTGQGQSIELELNTWSPWIEWEFAVTESFSVHAISRFVLLECGESVTVYMSCLQFHPQHPYAPFSEPVGYTAELANRYGLFKTIGWIYDTHAVRQDALTEDMFLTDVDDTMEWRAQLTLDEIDQGDFDLLVSCWTATDRVGHLFWRFRDPEHPLYDAGLAARYGKALEQSYKKADEIVGRVMARLSEDDALIVLSDHGFETFRRGFNVNTWLIRNGYLAVNGQVDAATASTDTPWLQDYDWANTKAYAIGLSSMYLNLRGREMAGIVDPSEADALIAEIKEKLLAEVDPETGARVFSAIYTRHDYSGAAMADAPDFSFGFAEGYQTSRGTARGIAPPELFEDNEDKWSGEHAASDKARLPGILFTNRPLTHPVPDIRDLGISALAYLGADIPDDFEGTPIF